MIDSHFPGCGGGIAERLLGHKLLGSAREFSQAANGTTNHPGWQRHQLQLLGSESVALLNLSPSPEFLVIAICGGVTT